MVNAKIRTEVLRRRHVVMNRPGTLVSKRRSGPGIRSAWELGQDGAASQQRQGFDLHLVPSCEDDPVGVQALPGVERHLDIAR